MLNSIKNFFYAIILRISIALYETENELLKAGILETKQGSRLQQRMRHRNNLLEKFLAGHRDERYTQDYYEVLKKADKFMKEASDHKIAVAADRHGMNYALKDKWGRRYEHLGFYDEKHKYAGKTIAEALVIEYEERKTKDDHYELLNIYDNSPVEVGLANIMSTVEKVDEEIVDYKYKVNDLIQHSKKFTFPIRCTREDDTILNKIEQLTESLHVKKIGFEYVQLEFFIPLKFGTVNITEDSKLFKDLTEINQIFINSDYGDLIGYGVTNFKKRIVHGDAYEVWKFDGLKMETIKTY
mgnify:CR=1 FL=1